MASTQQRYREYLEDQRLFFDELVTEDWDSYLDPWWDRTRRHEVTRILRHAKARRVLDVGCGCGFHDSVFAESTGIEEVVGIDYSEKSIEVAEREYPHPKVRRRVADIFELEDDGFDLVVSFQVIEHLRDPETFLALCAQRTAPGGRVVVVTPNRERVQNRYARLRRKPLQTVDPQHFQEFGLEDLRALGEQVGLRPVDSFGYGFTFIAPRLQRPVLPRLLAYRIGTALPTLADVIGQIFVRDGTVNA